MENRKKLWVFNPDCEMAIANGSKYYMPPVHVVTMAEDLAVLPAFLGKSEDWVLVRHLPDPAFMVSVYEPLQLKAGYIQEAEVRTLGAVKGEPWGWSPKMCHWLAERGMGEEWKTEQKEWYSRKKAREGLIRLFALIPDLEQEVIPEICYSIEEIEQKMESGKYLVKAPWSSSGKGILGLEKPIAVKEKERLHGILKRQGYVMLEKKLNKVLDFAMEFCAERQGVEFIGWSAFTTGQNGEYRGNFLGAQEHIEQLLASKLGEEKLQSLKQELPAMIAGILPDYRGYLGIDMMIYSDYTGKYRVQPCLEINLRYTMGIVALMLSRRYLDEHAKGEFTVRYYAQAGEAWQEHRRLQQLYPVVYKNNRILSGYLNLTPVHEATHFVASLICY